MKRFFILLIAVFAATYAWGWATKVPQGSMTTAEYTGDYIDGVNELFQTTVEQGRKLVALAKKPLPERPQFGEPN